MKLVFLCTNCGKELYPRNICFEEAEQMNTFSLYSKQDLFFCVHPCSCTSDIKLKMFKAIDIAVKSIQDELDKEISYND